jgi:hypothetical protein
MDPPVLEQIEYKLLCRAITDAVRLASKGDVTAGYDCLRAGLDRATEGVAAGEAGAQELVNGYRSALDHYSSLYLDQPHEVYTVRVEPPRPAPRRSKEQPRQRAYRRSA